MKITALLTLLVLAIPASAGRVVTREYQFRSFLEGTDIAIRVYMRITCKKGDDGKPGFVGRVEVSAVNVFTGGGRSLGKSYYRNYCPSPEEALGDFKDDIDVTRILPVPRPDALRLAAPPPIGTPADHRLYLTNVTGPGGRSSIMVLNTQTLETITDIEIQDRLFGGLQLSPDGRRLYAVLWPQSLGTPAPAYIAYIDTATNTIVDRLELPGLLQPQAPALSTDGRYLYFSAATETGPFRIRVADLQQKTIAVLPDPVPANTELRAVSLSPDGALLCSAGASALSCYDTRTRTFIGRTFVSLPNASLRPVFHPNGSRIYLLGRSFVNSVLSIHILVMDSGTLAEVARIPITNPAPNNFRDSLAVLSIDATGQRLMLDDGFSGTLNIIDTRTNRIIKTVEGLTTGALGGAPILR